MRNTKPTIFLILFSSVFAPTHGHSWLAKAVNISGLSIVEVELQLYLGVGIRLTETDWFGSWFS